MGVDIYGWSKVRLAEDQTFDADGEPTAGENANKIYINDDFPGRCTEWPQGAVLFVDGVYEHCYGRAYSGYSAWREELAKIAGYPMTDFEWLGQKLKRHDAGAWQVTEGPFWELINFSDCEGVIGTSVCKKLAKDFQDFQTKADEHENESWREGYKCMRHAFEIGADEGLVRFS